MRVEACAKCRWRKTRAISTCWSCQMTNRVVPPSFITKSQAKANMLWYAAGGIMQPSAEQRWCHISATSSSARAGAMFWRSSRFRCHMSSDAVIGKHGKCFRALECSLCLIGSVLAGELPLPFPSNRRFLGDCKSGLRSECIMEVLKNDVM